MPADVPRRASSVQRRFGFSLYAVVLFAYAYFFNGGGWNQNATFALTRALVEKQTIRVDDYRYSEDVAVWRGHVYINKAPGVSFFAAVPYALLYFTERSLGIDVNAFIANTINAYICTVVVCGALGALIPLLLWRYGTSVGVPHTYAIAVALLVAFGTPLFAYSTMLFLHGPSAALLLLALPTARKPLLSGLFSGLAGLSNYVALPVVPALALFAAFRGERKMVRLAQFASGAIPSLLALAAYHQAAFGSPFTFGAQLNERFLSTGAWMGLIQAPALDRLFGITISRYRGLFYLSPFLLVAITGVIILLRRKSFRAELLVILFTCGVFFGFNVSFNSWHGSATIGPRFLVPLIPFFAVLILHAYPVHRRLTIALGLIAVLINFAVVVVDPQPAEEIRDPLGNYIFPLLISGRPSPEAEIPQSGSWKARAGHTSVNLDSISGVASQWSSFNLGELLSGPGRLASLMPLIAVLAVAIPLLLRQARRLDAVGVRPLGARL